jgi:hypothetical protein
METLLIPWYGKLYKSNLTGGVYRLSQVKDLMAVLESVDGRTRIITEEANLKIFYRQLDGNELERAGMR